MRFSCLHSAFFVKRDVPKKTNQKKNQTVNWLSVHIHPQADRLCTAGLSSFRLSTLSTSGVIEIYSVVKCLKFALIDVN